MKAFLAAALIVLAGALALPALGIGGDDRRKVLDGPGDPGLRSAVADSYPI